MMTTENRLSTHRFFKCAIPVFAVVRTRCWNFLTGAILLCLICTPVSAQAPLGTRYAIGTPTLSALWVDPVHGNDANDGAATNRALRTITEAWNRIPWPSPLSSTGYQIWLMPGTYAEGDIPGWWESRHGSYNCPVIFQASGGRHTALLHGFPDVYDCTYLYFIDVDIVTDVASSGGGNTLHLAACHHILLRGCTLNGFDGVENKPQETLKANQVQYLYVEDCDISGAFWYPLDYMACQYGHIRGCKIHNAGEWCVLIKGGSSYFTVENNEIYDGHTGGFVAGNGAGFEYLVSPWLHYDASNIKFVNNVIHHTGTVGMGVNGGYNILLANNTLYKAGTNDHVIEVVQGVHSCDGDVPACASRLAAGGWGSTGPDVPIPCRNVFIFNNLIYNPSGFGSQYQQFWISGPQTAPAGCNVSNPVCADTNLRIEGNLIWNGAPSLPLGVEDAGNGGQPGNPTCNAIQLVADNLINRIEPQLVDPENGDFRALPAGSVFTNIARAIPAFAGDDRPAVPLAPSGLLLNSISKNRDDGPRYRENPVGAYTSGSSLMLETLPVTNGVVTARLLGEAGYHYRLDTSTNLLTWSPWTSTNTVGITNDFTTSALPQTSQRFIRAILVP